ncbi:MAG: hypothetical protein WBA97_27975 [Actinophytocola sp.]|uniref:hypothetical protein n=1 Tax=Actinophytocola sp. TaxID=1872138 RepID=UPI003C75BCA3
MIKENVLAARLGRPGVAALLTLLAILGLAIGAGPAQAASAASSAPSEKSRTVSVPMTLKGNGGAITNDTESGNCGSISLELTLVGDGSETQIDFGYKSILGPVRAHAISGSYQNAQNGTIGFFGDVGFPNIANYSTSDTVTTGFPAAPTAQMFVVAYVAAGVCTGTVADSLAF